MTFLLQVADLLADRDSDRWTSSLASRVISNGWDDRTASDAMMASLLSLPSHVLSRVISLCIASEGSEAVFAILPPPLQDIAISCAASDGDLHVPQAADTLFFLHLAKAIIPGAGLLSIVVPQFRTGPTLATAAMLARALCAHPSLTSLDLSDGYMRVKEFHTLTAALQITSLPALQIVRISVQANSGDLSDVVEFLKKTASARSILINLVWTNSDAAVQGYACSLQTAVRFAASPAHLQHLEDLVIHETAECEDDEGMDQVQYSLLGHLLASIRAPKLSHINLGTEARYLSRAALLVSLSRFENLRSLVVDAEALEPEAGNLPSIAAKVSLPALADLTVEGCCGWLPLEIAAAVAAAARSSLMALTVKNSGQSYFDTCVCRDSGCCSADERAKISRFWPAVGACVRLTSLTIRMLPAVQPGEEALQFSKAVAGCLGDLRRLTCLVLEPSGLSTKCVQLDRPEYACTLNGAVVGPALAALTVLQELHMSSGVGELVIEEPDALLASCGELLGLRTLGLCVERPQLRGVAELVPKLQHLKCVVLLPYMFVGDNEEDMNALQRAFPAIQFESGEYDSDSDSGSGFETE